MPDEPMIGLAEALRTLRSELAEAMREGEGQDLRFKVGPVELEFLVEVSRERGADGGVKFWVVNAGAKASVAEGQTHRVRLTLDPVTGEGGHLTVSDDVASRPQ